MANETTNLKLTKPLANEFYDINIFNDNFDKIDKELFNPSKTENTSYTTENGVKEFECKDGYVDNVVIEGETLVNIGTPSNFRTTTSATTYYIWDLQNMDMTLNKTITAFNFSDKTLRLDVRNGTSASSSFVRAESVSSNSSKVISLGATEFIQNYNGALTSGWSEELKDTLKCSCIILEGDHTDKHISYFEGLKSVGQGDKIEVLTRESGKSNLLKTQTITYKDNYMLNYSNGLESASNNHKYTETYIEIEPNTDYCFYHVSRNICWYDTNKTLINSPLNERTFGVDKDLFYSAKSPNNAKYLRVTIIKNIHNNGETSEIYKGEYDKKQILTTLRSLPNGVKDTIEKRGNKYYKIKRCYEGTLLKSQLTLNTGKNGYSFIMSDFGMPNIKPKNIYNVAEGRIVCNKLKEGKEYGYTIENGGIYHNQKDASSNQMITIATKGTENINEFTIVYELETPIIEELPNFNPQTFSDKTTLLLNTGVVQGEANFEVTNSLGSELEVLKNKVSNLDDSVVDEEVYYPTLLNGFQAPFVDDNVSIVRVDKICILNISAFNQSGYSVGTLLCKMNDRFKPRGTIRTYGFDLLNNKIVHLDINNEGVKIQNNVTSSANVRINVVWEVE